MGRAGRDGKQSWATILFRKGDVSHANAWVLKKTYQTKKDVTESYQDFRIMAVCYAHLGGLCRRRLILNLFGEKDTEPTSLGDCCDVYKSETNVSDHKRELKILIDAMDTIRSKGEVKIAEWIRGSNIT